MWAWQFEPIQAILPWTGSPSRRQRRACEKSSLPFAMNFTTWPIGSGTGYSVRRVRACSTGSIISRCRAAISLESRLEQAGFVPHDCVQDVVWEHRGGLFPQIVTHPNATWRLAVRVESVADFLTAHGMNNGVKIDGEPLAPFRKARVSAESDCEFWVVERHGYRGWETSGLAAGQNRGGAGIRTRRFGGDGDRFATPNTALRRLAGWSVPQSPIWGPAVPRTCFSRPNADTGPAATAPHDSKRPGQDALGLGWGNHDHHTYRCSREHFARLIALLEELGFVCRERFYAGREAGWGAQVLEQQESQVVVFADVDLSAAEVSDDFAHAAASARRSISARSACGACCTARLSRSPACTIWNAGSISTPPGRSSSGRASA